MPPVPPIPAAAELHPAPFVLVGVYTATAITLTVVAVLAFLTAAATIDPSDPDVRNTEPYRDAARFARMAALAPVWPAIVAWKYIIRPTWSFITATFANQSGTAHMNT